MKDNYRFKLLVEKYANNTLSQAEFQEFIHMLDKTNNLHLLDNILIGYWGAINHQKDLSDPAPKKKVFSKIAHWQLAASISILMAAIALFFVIQSPNGQFTLFQTDFGEILEIALPDGSKVTLNANSELAWNNEWKKQGSRRARLEGEAFFNIENLPDNMTFTVETGEIEVEVVGTSFNVEKRNQKLEVYLDEGKVKLHLEHDPKNAITLEPGQKAKFHAGQKKIEKTMNESMISSASWKKGVLNFKDMEFREVLDKLKYIYGKSFKCEDDKLLSKTIYLGVPYSDWEEVRQALELSLNIQLLESENTIKITSN